MNTFKKETHLYGVLGIVTGVSFERGLEKIKIAVEAMTGETANEFTIAHGVRVSLCKDALLAKYPVLRLAIKNNYSQEIADQIVASMTPLVCIPGTQMVLVPQLRI